MSNLPRRSLRLESKSKKYLDQLSGARGEIFYDYEADSLRIFNGRERIGSSLLTTDLANLDEGDVNFGTRTIIAGTIQGSVSGQVDDISNHNLGGLGDVSVDGVTSGQVLYWEGTQWQATTLSSTFNGGNVGGATRFLNTTQSTDTGTGAVTIDGGVGIDKDVFIGGLINVASTITAGNATLGSIDASGGLTIATDKFTVNSTTGDILAAGSATIGGNTEITGTVTIKDENAIIFYDSDSSNYISFKAPTNLSTDIAFVLPTQDGDPNQVLQTDGAGTLGWVTLPTGGGGGGGSITAAGSTGQVQFNGGSGTLAADVDFSFTTATNTLAVPFITATRLTGAVTGAVTGNVVGNVAGDVQSDNGVTILDNGTDGTDAVFTGSVTGNVTGDTNGTHTGAVTSDTATVTGGTIDDTAIGATTPSTGAFTTLNATGTTTFTKNIESSSPTTGAVKVSGGLGVALNTNVGGNITANGDISAQGSISAGGSFVIENDPVETTDATNKKYVDVKSIAMSIALS
jgi:hypothetical protein